MRTPMIAGNWKMNLTFTEALDLVTELLGQERPTGPEVLICPPFPYLAALADVLEDTGIRLGAQNMYYENAGAYTGEVAPAMLKSVGCTYVILGHSERRQLFGERDELIAAKLRAAFAADLTPILCVGETQEQREEGETRAHIDGQLRSALKERTSVEGLIVAYEPIWAIGTGKTATAAQAEEVCAQIRGTLATLCGTSLAERTRILYGGSVKPANIKMLMAQENIDGALVGGASLNAGDFAALIRYEEA